MPTVYPFIACSNWVEVAFDHGLAILETYYPCIIRSR